MDGGHVPVAADPRPRRSRPAAHRPAQLPRPAPGARCPHLRRHRRRVAAARHALGLAGGARPVLVVLRPRRPGARGHDHAPATTHELTLTTRVHAGRPQPLLLALATAEGEVTAGDSSLTVAGTTGWRLDWHGADGIVSDDAPLHADSVSRGTGWTTIAVEPTASWTLRVAADHVSPPADEPAPRESFWDSAARTLDIQAAGAFGGRSALIEPIREALPWFAHDAFVHYLSPRGLEQYSGGAWGTRDVCQGPVGLLTALDRQDAVRDLLGRVFRAQNARGDWPQAFEFVPPLPTSGQQDSHGDVVFWPLLATGEHLLAAGDPGILDGRPCRSSATAASPSPGTVADHLARALDRIEAGTVRGTPLPAYGHGDWNDSLQPADPHLARHLVSVWTACCRPARCASLAAGLRAVGAEPGLAERAAALADATEDAIHHRLVADEVLPGYVLRRRRRRARAARAPARRAHRAHVRHPAVGPRHQRRPAHRGAGRAPPRPRRAAPARPRRRPALRPAGRLRGRADGRVPAGRGQHVLGARDRPDVPARPPALRRGPGPGRPRAPSCCAPSPWRPRAGRSTWSGRPGHGSRPATPPRPTGRSPTATTRRSATPP